MNKLASVPYYMLKGLRKRQGIFVAIVGIASASGSYLLYKDAVDEAPYAASLLLAGGAMVSLLQLPFLYWAGRGK